MENKKGISLEKEPISVNKISLEKSNGISLKKESEIENVNNLEKEKNDNSEPKLDATRGVFMIGAVVIFGVFIALMYSLFQNELRGNLESMFESAIQQEQKSLGVEKTKEKSKYNPSVDKEIDKLNK